MRRIGRLLALAAVLAVVIWASTAAIPGLVDATDEGGDTDCEFRYLVFTLEAPTTGERANAINYTNLSAARRTAFDMYLAGGDGPITLDRTLWNELNEQSEPVHYVRYEGAIYRARPLLRGCDRWERYGNGTIP